MKLTHITRNVVALFSVLMLSNCNADPTAQKHKEAITYQPSTTEPTKEPDYEAEYRNQGDIYTNRSELIRMLKRIDPTADFSGNYAENSDKLDDTFSGNDKYGCDLQVIGSRKHIKEVNFTYRPDAYYNNKTYYGFNIINKIGKLLCKIQGDNFTKLFLAAIKADPNTAFIDSGIVNDKKMIMGYNTKENTVTFTVKHK